MATLEEPEEAVCPAETPRAVFEDVVQPKRLV
jgi:hypothetical protein